ncbi:hypothetical protein FRC01_002254 [Tulasnella sp. 417]|nr:hypothetical protein FRC01_002254 [Tulasnella sp. 417]
MSNRNQQGRGFIGAIAQYMAEPEPAKDPKGNVHGKGAATPNRNAPEPPVVLGLTELCEVLGAMANAPLGARPKLNQDLIERIKNSPLHPVLNELQPIYKKLGPLEGSPEHLQAQAQAEAAGQTGAHPPTSRPESSPGPGPSPPHAEPTPPASTAASGPSPPQQPPLAPAVLDAAALKTMEAGLMSLTSKLDFVTKVVTDVTTRTEMVGSFQTLEGRLHQADSETRGVVKESTNAAKTQIERVDKKVTQVADTLDPALAELKQGVQRLQVGLLDGAKAERTRLETRVKELEKENKELQQVIINTNAELLPVEVVAKIALQGTFTIETDTGKPDTGKSGTGNSGTSKPDASKPGSREGTNNAMPNILQTAKKVRDNTLGLVAKCRALFMVMAHDPETESNISDLGKEGEWGRCAEHVRAFHSKLRNAVKEKEDSDQKLQFVGFVIEQIRKGHYTEQEWEGDTNWGSVAALVEKSPDGFTSIRLLAEDLSRLTAQATTRPISNDSTSPAAFEGSQTSTTKPIKVTTQAPPEPSSTPAFTAPGSPAVPTKPIPGKKDRDDRYANLTLKEYVCSNFIG